MSENKAISMPYFEHPFVYNLEKIEEHISNISYLTLSFIFKSLNEDNKVGTHLPLLITVVGDYFRRTCNIEFNKFEKQIISATINKSLCTTGLLDDNLIYNLRNDVFFLKDLSKEFAYDIDELENQVIFYSQRIIEGIQIYLIFLAKLYILNPDTVITDQLKLYAYRISPITPFIPKYKYILIKLIDLLLLKDSGLYLFGKEK